MLLLYIFVAKSYRKENLNQVVFILNVQEWNLLTKKRFIINRILQVIPMLFIISIIAFTLSHFSTGDVAEITLRNEGGQVTPEAVDAVRAELGLDKPLVTQYFNWLGNVIKLDFGTSFRSNQPVWDEIVYRFPATFMLALCAAVLSILLAIPMAMISAKYKDTWIDHSFRFISTGGATMPDFFLGLLLLYLFAIHLDIFPVVAGNQLQHIFLPAFTLSLGYAAIYTRLLRTNIIEVMDATYMKAAKIKGLSNNAVLIKHGLKNAIIPCITLMGSNFGTLVTGSFAVEMIFSWNGIGMFALESIKAKDLPVIQGYILFVAISFVLINLIIDICYTYIDPKIKLK